MSLTATRAIANGEMEGDVVVDLAKIRGLIAEVPTRSRGGLDGVDPNYKTRSLAWRIAMDMVSPRPPLAFQYKDISKDDWVRTIEMYVLLFGPAFTVYSHEGRWVADDIAANVEVCLGAVREKA